MGDGVVQLSSAAHHDNILSCLQQLRLGGQLIDIIVQVDHHGEVEEFQAHQVMLAAYSGYFKRLLLSRDAVPDKLFLSDIRTANFSTFLDFVYTGRAEVARDKLADVRAAAVLLDCKDLSEVCVAAMTASAPSEESPAAAAAAAAVGQSDEYPSPEAGGKKQPRLRGLKRKSPLKGGDANKDPSFVAPAERVNDDSAVPQVETADEGCGRRSSIRLAGRKISTGVLKRWDPRGRRAAETLDPDSPSSETDENKTAEEEHADAPPQSLAVKDEDRDKSSDGDVVVRVVIGADDDDEYEEEDDGVGSVMPERCTLYLSGEEEEEEEEEEGGDGKRTKKRTSKALFQCGSCQRTFHYARSYIKHISMYHGVRAEVSYQCETCHQTFANRGNLKIHQKHVHNDERLFPCQVCGKNFKRKKDVMRHQRQVHEGGGQRHMCPRCGKSLSSKAALTLHERTHTGDKPFQCTECGAKFSQSSALKMHQRIHTGEKPYACDLCEARFTQKHMLVYHKRSHTGERPFMCEACGKSFASKEYLRHHSNIHTGSRPYKCPQCGRGFAQRNSLHQHLKIHTGERPYSCKDCTKQFTQLNALQRHQRIHTGEKPYMCGLCKRTFTDKSTVRRHTMTHTTDGPWKNYLVVLEGNMEGTKRKPSTKDDQGQGAPGAEGNQDQTPANEAAAAKLEGAEANQAQNPAKEEAAAKLEGAEAKTETPPSEAAASSLLVPGQPVTLPADWASRQPITLPADWAAHGTIALVSHSALGGITVIHAAGTQLQPIVTTDATGASIISLDGSTIAVPFSLAHAVAHGNGIGGISTATASTSTTADRLSEALKEALTEVSVSHAVDDDDAAAESQPGTCVLEDAVSQTILAPEVAPPEDEAEAEATGPEPPTAEGSGVQDADQFAAGHADEATPPSDHLLNTEGTPSGEEPAVVIV